jgi:hypothetical protein
MKFIITEEQSEKLNHKVKSMVNKYGIEETLRLFDDNADIIKHAYQDNPLEFLEQFNDLTRIEKGNMIYYVDNDRTPLIYYYMDKINGYVYINYDRIWSFFEDVIGLKRSEILNILKNWLEETYNIRALTPLPLEFYNPYLLGGDL